MHRIDTGTVCRFNASGTHIVDALQRYLGTEVQVTRHMNVSGGLVTEKGGPAYEVQSLDDGNYFYCCECCLTPRNQERGSWSTLAAFYKPPIHRNLEPAS